MDKGGWNKILHIEYYFQIYGLTDGHWYLSSCYRDWFSCGGDDGGGDVVGHVYGSVIHD